MNTIIATMQDQIAGFGMSVQEFMTPDVVVTLIFAIIGWLLFSWLLKNGLTQSLRMGLVEDAPVLKEAQNGYMTKTILGLVGVSIIGFIFSNSEPFASLLIENLGDGVIWNKSEGLFALLKLWMYIGLFRIAYEMSKTIKYMKAWSEENRAQVAIYIQEIVKWVTLIFGSYLVLAGLQFDPVPLIASMGVISIGAGFAIKDMMSNALGFLSIMMSKKIKINERISVAGITGKVIDHTPSEMKILDDNRDIVLIPNHIINSNIIENHTRGEKSQVVVDIPLSHTASVTDIEAFYDRFATEFHLSIPGHDLSKFQPQTMFISNMTEKAMILSITGIIDETHPSGIQFYKNAIYRFAISNMDAAFSSEKVFALDTCKECECDVECIAEVERIEETECCVDCDDFDENGNYKYECDADWHEAEMNLAANIPVHMMPSEDELARRLNIELAEAEEAAREEEAKREEENLINKFLDSVSDVKDDLSEYSFKDLRNDFGDKIGSLFGRGDKEKEDERED